MAYAFLSVKDADAIKAKVLVAQDYGPFVRLELGDIEIHIPLPKATELAEALDVAASDWLTILAGALNAIDTELSDALEELESAEEVADLKRFLALEEEMERKPISQTGDGSEPEPEPEPNLCLWHGAEDATEIGCAESDTAPCGQCAACVSAYEACSPSCPQIAWPMSEADAADLHPEPETAEGAS